MDLTHGILLMFIGMTLTIVGLFLAYHYGSKSNKPKEKLTTVQQSLRDLNK